MFNLLPFLYNSFIGKAGHVSPGPAFCLTIVLSFVVIRTCDGHNAQLVPSNQLCGITAISFESVNSTSMYISRSQKLHDSIFKSMQY